MPLKFFLHSCSLWLGKAEATSFPCLNETPELVKDRSCELTAEDEFLSPTDTWLLIQQVDLEGDHNQHVQKHCCVTMTLTQPFHFPLNST